MPQGIQHRIVLVGVHAALQPALRAALGQRVADPVVLCPDLAAAAKEATLHPAETHLFIVELDARSDLSNLAGLTTSFPGQPVLTLLPPGTEMGRLLAVQRAGAAQIVPLPFQSEDFLRALDCVALQFAPVGRHARLLAVCGVSGGCGGTTLGLNLAYELAQSSPAGRRGVLLVELARQMGTLATYLDIAPPITVHELLADPSRLTTQGIRQALTGVAPGLDVLVGPYLDIAPGAVSPRHVYQLVELCRKLASIVILDVACAFDDLQFETLALADQVVLVGVQAVSSVRTLKMVRDTLEREEGIQGQRLVINRYEPGMPGFNADRLAELLQVPQVHTIANDYPSVMSALNHGKPLQIAAPHSRVLADIRSLAATLGPPTATGTSGESGDRLARALGRMVPARRGPRAIQVLHIEDDEVQQAAMTLHLGAIRDFTCTVTPVASEAGAVEVFRHQTFDVVLLDYHLAQGNGLACLRQLRALDAIVPIVVVSGVAKPQIAAELLEAGADDFLSKENLSSERLGRALAAAVARADACKVRLPAGDAAQVDAFFDRVRRTMSVNDESELLRSLRELYRANRPGRFSAAQIQRLVDLVCGELGSSSAGIDELPRRALLTLFLRLFGAGETESA